MLRLGIADHLGWAVAVTATDEHAVVDRRRIELVEPGVTQAPIHYVGRDGGSVAAMEVVVAEWRASVGRAAAAALDELPGGIVSIALRDWPADFPADVETQLRVPWEARADAVMYRQILAALARDRGWEVVPYDAKDVERRAADVLGDRADAVLKGPRKALGPPWNKDHRTALAATVVG